MRRRVTGLQFLLFLIETLIFWITAFAVSRHSAVGTYEIFQYFVTYFCLFIFLYAFGAYDLCMLLRVREWVLRLLQGAFLGGVVSVAFLLILGQTLTRSQYLLPYGAFVLCAIVLRFAMAIAVRRGVRSEKVLVIGNKNQIQDILMDLSHSLARKLQPVGYCNSTLEDLDRIIASKAGIHAILVADPVFVRKPGVRERVNFLRKKGIQVEYLPAVAERNLGRIPLELASIFNSYYEISFASVMETTEQRAFNLAISFIGICIAWPIMLLVALAVLVDSGKPVLFRQRRIGLYGEIFTLLKFRTMENGTNDDSRKFNGFEQDQITRVGRFLRRTRLDELPQLLNVFRGDMSLIGPRPEMPYFHEKASDEIPFYSHRLRLRPGITGWAQVNYKHTSTMEDYRKKTEYDLYYVKNRTLALDLQICLRTIETIFGMKGAK